MHRRIILLVAAVISLSGLFGIAAFGYADNESEFDTAPCTDSEGATTGFFCQPLSLKAKMVPACDTKKPKDLAACQAQGAAAYCRKRGYSRAQSYSLDAKGNLAELVCGRQTVVAAAAGPTPPVAAAPPVEEWQPMFNVDLTAYDLQEFPLQAGQDWRVCKAACEANGSCKAWTQSLAGQGRTLHGECYLKWDVPPAAATPCCVSGVKGASSYGARTSQRNRTPEELKRLGQRTKNAAEDEVGRRAEDAVRRGIGDIIP